MSHFQDATPPPPDPTEQLPVGRVHAVFAAPAGPNAPTFPKAKTASAKVTATGFQGDHSAEAIDADFGGHGGPIKAVCIWSFDVMREMQKQGHPIQEGGTGENLSLAGLPWEKVVPGCRLEIGEVLLEVTRHARPCKKQVGNFTGSKIMVINHLSHPGRSRFYCAVLFGGTVREGDPVKLHIHTHGAKPYLEDPDIVGRFAKTGLPTAALNVETHVVALLTGVAVGAGALVIANMLATRQRAIR